MTDRPPPSLVARLAYPAHDRTPARHWGKLVANLFDDLLRLFARDVQPPATIDFNLEACAESCVGWLALPAATASGFPASQRVMWNKVVALLECAAQAKAYREGSGSRDFRLERLSKAFVDAMTAAQIADFNAWLHELDHHDHAALAIYCKMLFSASGQRNDEHHVPVAYLPRPGATRGEIGRLTLREVPGGQASLAQEPTDWIVTSVRDNFKLALADAWQAALAQTEPASAKARPSMLWRALAADARPDGDPKPLLELEGRSAAGAFFYASGRVLQDRTVDPVLVIVDVRVADQGGDTHYELGPLSVDGVRAKLEGLLAHNELAKSLDSRRTRIDTVVLSKAQSMGQADRTLLDRVDASHVRVEYA